MAAHRVDLGDNRNLQSRVDLRHRNGSAKTRATATHQYHIMRRDHGRLLPVKPDGPVLFTFSGGESPLRSRQLAAGGRQRAAGSWQGNELVVTTVLKRGAVRRRFCFPATACWQLPAASGALPAA